MIKINQNRVWINCGCKNVFCSLKLNDLSEDFDCLQYFWMENFVSSRIYKYKDYKSGIQKTRPSSSTFFKPKLSSSFSAIPK